MQLIKKTIETFISRIWYGQGVASRAAALLLSPLSIIYRSIADENKRKALANRVDDLPIKTIVIGNITAGGTGKTPLLIAVAKQLASKGWSPGIISRGHGGLYLKGEALATRVQLDSDPFWVGDEPVLIAQALQTMPVVVCPRRIEAVALLLKDTDCNIILSDDGLQHYALPRDIEVVLIDAARGFGNQKLLPAGPLREPIERLKDSDIVIFNGQPSPQLKATVAQYPLANYSISMAVDSLRSIDSSGLVSNDLSQLNRYSVIHLVAGIGHPERFFNAIHLLLSDNENAPEVIEHAYPDHHCYKESDLKFPQHDGNEAIVMTAKDAVKCAGFINNPLPLYAVDVSARFEPSDTALIDAICSQLVN
ncbi:MAG: tetraacyldisaccharide 4'-kinase [Pseudomonadales bacterium]|nr:tetraacyldisaccharide 4'-kinase [Pseudomonadales bacterium]MDB2409484.1 tetraacyldisaccharide 4'-kinase [Pseudomonadales bacterium]MDG1937435.1 tetraacyldisaccharide 4'-kinase [Pseudomonadales bacterium]MDG2035036.1 tetraacyldisaccharide 4'-kinase [Pseudomonadales bacterium]